MTLSMQTSILVANYTDRCDEYKVAADLLKFTFVVGI